MENINMENSEGKNDRMSLYKTRECENSWCDNIQEMKETNIYESIEDKLEEIISNESVDMIEEFLGYELTFTASEDIHSQVRDSLDQMPEEELLLWEEKYDLL